MCHYQYDSFSETKGYRLLSAVIAAQHYITMIYVVLYIVTIKCVSWLVTYVMPLCRRKLDEDGEFGLFTVTLFKKVIDEFKLHCREHK